MSPFHNHESYNAHSSDNIKGTHLQEAYVTDNNTFPLSFVHLGFSSNLCVRLWRHFVDLVNQ